ncbi:MAG: tetratricopeptide repeat protein [Treponema sp.]|nr:tetratricopeptide repeat protein [Treponema sp.]MCL2271907.1 tetratricopeptide repeat protein [Treponema sp.]
MGVNRNYKDHLRKIFAIMLLFVVLIPVTACKLLPENLYFNGADVDPYYITGSKEEREHFLDLFNILKTEEPGSEDEFSVIREIAASFARLKDFDRLIHFLSARIINNPADIYNSYYLLMIAYANVQQDSLPIAALYFDMIVMNYPDFIINDESIHLICLRQLINLNRNPERQVLYYQELISRFPEKIDLGIFYFMLGQACEKIGDWNGAIQAYSNYLPYTGTIIQGFPNADQYARQKVDFSKSPKDWTFESLPVLRAAIEDALDEGSARQLSRYQAKVNFFGRSWGQTETDDARMVDFNLAEFMYNNRIRYASDLDASSNATEAFLRTTGWSTYLQTWYLYFRKIHFPQDPEIHGRWEWAGIYYGEKI